MAYRDNTAERTTITRDLREMEKPLGNVYETIVVLSKRSNQINSELKEELSQKLDEFASTTDNLEEIFEGVTSVLVQGDTTSAFSIALAAFHRRIKVIHLEAGLRTYDKNQPYPEEFNRQAISRIADVHLCPTELSKIFLSNEPAFTPILIAQS